MATKRKRPIKRDNSFYEALSVPAGRSIPRQAIAEQSRNVSKFLTATLAAVIIVAVALTARSTVFVSKAQATPSGSVVISGASAFDAQLQPTESTNYYQSTRGDFQVQENQRFQAYSDAANLQGGIPAQ